MDSIIQMALDNLPTALVAAVTVGILELVFRFWRAPKVAVPGLVLALSLVGELGVSHFEKRPPSAELVIVGMTLATALYEYIKQIARAARDGAMGMKPDTVWRSHHAGD